MITLSSLLTAGGCEAQLEVHINAALNVGISKEKIIECFMQCIPYTGFPKVLNAVFVAKKVFETKDERQASNLSVRILCKSVVDLKNQTLDK